MSMASFRGHNTSEVSQQGARFVLGPLGACYGLALMLTGLALLRLLDFGEWNAIWLGLWGGLFMIWYVRRVRAQLRGCTLPASGVIGHEPLDERLWFVAKLTGAFRGVLASILRGHCAIGLVCLVAIVITQVPPNRHVTWTAMGVLLYAIIVHGMPRAWIVWLTLDATSIRIEWRLRGGKRTRIMMSVPILGCSYWYDADSCILVVGSDKEGSGRHLVPLGGLYQPEQLLQRLEQAKVRNPV